MYAAITLKPEASLCSLFQILAAGSSNGKQGEEEETGGLPLHDSSAEEEENPAASDGEPGDGRSGEEHAKLADFSGDDYEKRGWCPI